MIYDTLTRDGLPSNLTGGCIAPGAITPGSPIASDSTRDGLPYNDVLPKAPLSNGNPSWVEGFSSGDPGVARASPTPG